MIVVGLTGSIGMGKTTTARLFAEDGAAVFDADAEVAALYAEGGAGAAAVAALFPDAIRDGAVDRPALAAHLERNPEDFARLEAAVHPLVARAREDFLKTARARGAEIAVLDIPLLFETGLDEHVDRIVVVTAPESVQSARVRSRPGMTEARLRAILARQVPDSDKRARADFVIDTSRGLDAARAEVRRIMESLRRGTDRGSDT